MPEREDPWLAPKMAELAIIARHEREVMAGALGAIGGFLELARARVLGQPDPALPALVAAALVADGEGGTDTPPPVPNESAWPTPAEWQAFVATSINPPLGAAFGQLFLDAASSAAVSATPYAEHHLATVWDRLVIWPAGAFEELRYEIIASHNAGESFDVLRDRIGQVLDIDAPSRAIRARAYELRTIRDDESLDAAVRAQARAELTGLYKRLPEADRQWHYLARRIARTEVMGALNAGRHNGAVAYAEATGLVRYKQWLSCHDARVRQSHRAADGQVRPLTEPYQVGGYELMYPCEPGGPAFEVIQCRCMSRILTPEDAAVAAQTAAQTAIDNGEQPHPIPAALQEDTVGTTNQATVAAAGDTAPASDEGQNQEDRLPNGWRGPLCPLDTLSGDGRVLGTPPEGLRVRPYPLPFKAQLVSGWGHEGSIVAGLIERAWVEGTDGMDMVWGEGPLDLADEQAAEFARKLRDGFAGWVSVDCDDTTGELRCMDSTGKIGDCESMGEVDEDGWLISLPEDVRIIEMLTDWRLMGATLVADAAFAEVRVEPVYDYQRSTEPAQAAVAAAGVATVIETARPAIAAAGGPLYPPDGWFGDPSLPGPTPLVVMDSGRIMGHLAAWGTDHIGAQGQRIRPPRGGDYSHFTVGSALVEGGKEIPVGVLTLGTPHAALHLDAAEAMTHYSHTGRQVAVVVAGEDRHGIWVAGSLLPGVDEQTVAAIRRSPLSGDWRTIGGRLQLVAALHVNTPGFPLPRQRTGVDARAFALVAAGALPALGRLKGVSPADLRGLSEHDIARVVSGVLKALDHRDHRARRLATARSAMVGVRRDRAAARLGR